MAPVASGAATPLVRTGAEACTAPSRTGSASSADFVVPAYEDTAHWLLKEGNLPENVDPVQSEDRRSRRARAHGAHVRARAFEADRLRAAGAALECAGIARLDERELAAAARQAVPRAGRFAGGLALADERAAVGRRRRPIPTFIRRIRWRSAANCPIPAHVQYGAAQPRAGPARQDSNEQSFDGRCVRTALTIEPREGALCVFMPPVERLEDYLELLAAVEIAARERGLPVHIEGYPPPNDPRMNVIKVTPDPGVIEVNIHPAASWREAVDNTTALYEEARQVRLGTDKFMIDGRHTGTGGGNHVVLGGADPAAFALPAPARICCAASCSTGSAIPRCPICFRGCSSAPRARRRAWTRRAMIPSTNSKSPSPTRPGRTTRAFRRGWWTGSIATCSSM